jgi:hypothetical protein
LFFISSLFKLQNNRPVLLQAAEDFQKGSAHHDKQQKGHDHGSSAQRSGVFLGQLALLGDQSTFHHVLRKLLVTLLDASLLILKGKKNKSEKKKRKQFKQNKKRHKLFQVVSDSAEKPVDAWFRVHDVDRVVFPPAFSPLNDGISPIPTIAPAASVSRSATPSSAQSLSSRHVFSKRKKKKKEKKKRKEEKKSKIEKTDSQASGVLVTPTFMIQSKIWLGL